MELINKTLFFTFFKLYKQIIRAAVGDGIAAITFDDDYKMIRRHVNSHQHANIISRLGGSVSMVKRNPFPNIFLFLNCLY